LKITELSLAASLRLYLITQSFSLMKRRSFLSTSLKFGTGLAIAYGTPVELLANYRRQYNLNNEIGVALIGCKGMGWSNLASMLKIPEVKCIALCDVDENVLRQRAAELDKINIKPSLHGDYRKVLELKEVDVVIIGTPDHWHCLMMVDACAAGKDVFVEKPASNSIGEAAIMVAAAKKYNRLVQVNQWQRSQQHFKDAIAYVQGGKLGTIAQTKTWMYNGHGILPAAGNTPVPAGVDYNSWLGPAPKREFNPNRFHYNFRWYWDYAGGLMTDWGVHLIDMVLFGMQASAPKKITALGGHIAYPNDARETPDTQTAIYEFGAFQMIWEHTMGRQYGLYGMGHGIAFVGNNGTLLLNRGGWEVRPETENKTPKLEAVSWQKSQDSGLDLHTKNFIEALQNRNAALLNCPIEAGAMVAQVSHMGNVALRTGRQIAWDDTAKKFDDKQANELLTASYHNGWKLPKV
jgi:predicted dehydrogenase